MGRSSFAFFALVALAACDKVEQAIDANNTQPGEADGRAVQMTALDQRVNRMAADDKEFVIAADNGDVLTRPREGADAAKRIGGFKRASYTSEGDAMLIDADAIYVADSSGLYRMPRTGGDGERLNVDTEAGGLAQSKDALFVPSKDHTKILRVDKKTKAVTDLATGFMRVSAIIGDGDKIDVADRDAETISVVPMAGGATVLLAKDQAQPAYIGLGPDHVYWVNGSLSDHKDVANLLMRVKKDGSGAVEPLASQSGGFEGPIAADAQFVYLGRAGYGLFRAPVAGGESTKFVNMAVTDFFLTSDKIIAIENNGFRFSDDEKSKPNRLLGVTK